MADARLPLTTFELSVVGPVDARTERQRILRNPLNFSRAADDLPEQ